MGLPLNFIIENKNEIRKQMRLFDKDKRTTKASRQRNRKMRANERARVSRMETFKKVCQYREELEA